MRRFSMRYFMCRVSMRRFMYHLMRRPRQRQQQPQPNRYPQRQRLPPKSVILSEAKDPYRLR
jgi:hypothetical protein